MADSRPTTSTQYAVLRLRIRGFACKRERLERLAAAVWPLAAGGEAQREAALGSTHHQSTAGADDRADSPAPRIHQ